MSEIGIYQQTILEHSKNPLNFKSLNPCTHQANGNNPLCGDKVEIFSNIKNDINNEICFQGSGCAISIASASILTKVLHKRSVVDCKIIIENFVKMIENKEFNFDLLDNEKKKLLMTFSELQKFPMRTKCATMSWSTFKAALNRDKYNTVINL
ncbi:MAG: SUF system NifU family Fe-S cluster assembly protein [Pelagibacteraceae bacterium]|jgi:nitrogen fixation NifU-like protein